MVPSSRGTSSLYHFIVYNFSAPLGLQDSTLEDLLGGESSPAAKAMQADTTDTKPHAGAGEDAKAPVVTADTTCPGLDTSTSASMEAATLPSEAEKVRILTYTRTVASHGVPCKYMRIIAWWPFQ